MKWITREKIRIDRCASAWLIGRFVDEDAELLFAPASEVLNVARDTGAIAFHVKGAELEHTDARTAFDAIMAKYNLADPALVALADIVRAADKRAKPDNVAAEGAGVAAMSHGFAAMNLSDEQVLELQLPMWEALYQFCKLRSMQTQSQ